MQKGGESFIRFSAFQLFFRLIFSYHYEGRGTYFNLYKGNANMSEQGYKQIYPLFGHDEKQLLYRIEVYKHFSDKTAPDRFLTEDEKELIQLTPNTFQIVGTDSVIKTQEKYPYS